MVKWWQNKASWFLIVVLYDKGYRLWVWILIVTRILFLKIIKTFCLSPIQPSTRPETESICKLLPPPTPTNLHLWPDRMQICFGGDQRRKHRWYSKQNMQEWQYTWAAIYINVCYKCWKDCAKPPWDTDMEKANIVGAIADLINSSFCWIWSQSRPSWELHLVSKNQDSSLF